VTGNSVYKTASSIGINFQRDGSIALDSSAFTTALSTNKQDVVNVMKSLSDALYDKMNMYVDPYTGSMTSIQNAITDNMSHIDDRIKDLNARYERETEALQQRYNALEVQMNSSSLLKNWLTQQTDYMTGKKS
jgi:flagellar hook-associated protein 2